MAEQYVFEHLSSCGLDSVVYQEFPGESGAPPGRNVIGQIDGTTHASEIVVLGAHIDDFPWNGFAPGADDDASGVAATLYLAQVFAGRTFERTLRFAFFGDEENAPWMCEKIGSAGYAAQCRAADDDIVAMIQADSIAFDPPESGSHIVEMIARRTQDDPGGADIAIASLWQDAITTYGITGILPRTLTTSNNWSDHGSFWKRGYPAVMLIEEELEHWNPNWHTVNDTVAAFDWSFYVQVTRSYLAAAAHLAEIDTSSGDPEDDDDSAGSADDDEDDDAVAGDDDTGGTAVPDDDELAQGFDCGCQNVSGPLGPQGIVLLALSLVSRRRSR